MNTREKKTTKSHIGALIIILRRIKRIKKKNVMRIKLRSRLQKIDKIVSVF